DGQEYRRIDVQREVGIGDVDRGRQGNAAAADDGEQEIAAGDGDVTAVGSVEGRRGILVHIDVTVAEDASAAGQSQLLIDHGHSAGHLQQTDGLHAEST